MVRRAVILLIAVLVAAWPDAAVAQADAPRFELGVQVPFTRSSEFDSGDVGIGGLLSWQPGGWIGVEAEIALYPRAFPDSTPFSRRRVEGLFGATFGPTLSRVRPFAKLRSGFLDLQKPGPIACILIYPPPLSCALASGRTLLAFDFGGGVELFTSPNTFARVEAGDRVLKYPGPVFDRSFTRRDDAFFSHDFRFAAGAGFRF
jgi:hypothetical protein